MRTRWGQTEYCHFHPVTHSFLHLTADKCCWRRLWVTYINWLKTLSNWCYYVNSLRRIQVFLLCFFFNLLQCGVWSLGSISCFPRFTKKAKKLCPFSNWLIMSRELCQCFTVGIFSTSPATSTDQYHVNITNISVKEVYSLRYTILEHFKIALNIKHTVGLHLFWN